ncbi:hypothetical protein F5X96DRAFT_370606 [Biscogniauxia mediterranea]|nr:hypothetical protein F5X96DRAFT_370606 [Biscogniauxia mediterranea]
MPITWNEKSERDLLLAMLMSSSPPGQFKSPSWATVVKNMATMGYSTNQSAISQRWSKNIFHDLKQNHPDMFNSNGGANAPAAAAAAEGAAQPATAAAAGKKRGRGRPPKAKKVKREAEEEGDLAAADDNDDVDLGTDRPVKMQKLDNSGGGYYGKDDNDDDALV